MAENSLPRRLSQAIQAHSPQERKSGTEVVIHQGGGVSKTGFHGEHHGTR